MREQLKAGLTARVWVDADACPVKNEIERIAAREGLAVIHVTATAMRDRDAPGDVRVVRIEGGPDAVDEWIVARLEKDDIVVTQDIPLAAEAIAKGARVIENRGELLSPVNIGMKLAVRNLMADLRDTGSLDGNRGPKPITPRDRQRFASALNQLITAMRNEAKF